MARKPNRSQARPEARRQHALPPKIDLDALAARQGVRPIEDPAEMRADFWPEDETADEFIATVRRWRREGSKEALP